MQILMASNNNNPQFFLQTGNLLRGWWEQLVYAGQQLRILSFGTWNPCRYLCRLLVKFPVENSPFPTPPDFFIKQEIYVASVHIFPQILNIFNALFFKIKVIIFIALTRMTLLYSRIFDTTYICGESHTLGKCQNFFCCYKRNKTFHKANHSLMRHHQCICQHSSSKTSFLFPDTKTKHQAFTCSKH